MDRSITIAPLRRCPKPISIGENDSLYADLPERFRAELDFATLAGGAVGEIRREAWDALHAALRKRHRELIPLLDWMIAQAEPTTLNSAEPADASWLEQQDATRTVIRVSGFPNEAVAAWRRPSSPDDSYLTGLIPQPSEDSLIQHDVVNADRVFELTSNWRSRDADQIRCDIHILTDPHGRRLEIANVNATGVETRTGTDLIYYHVPSESFVMVQYKRLRSHDDSITVNEQLLEQLTKLEGVARLSKEPLRPVDWRLATDPCYLKLAYWPTPQPEKRLDLTPGMYLPVSYVRLLLNDPSTQGPRGGRRLGYPQVERYLVGSQFVDLVKHGLTGTVRATREDLNELVLERAKSGQSVVVGTEATYDSAKERSQNGRRRNERPLPKQVITPAQGSLFDI